MGLTAAIRWTWDGVRSRPNLHSLLSINLAVCMYSPYMYVCTARCILLYSLGTMICIGLKSSVNMVTKDNPCKSDSFWPVVSPQTWTLCQFVMKRSRPRYRFLDKQDIILVGTGLLFTYCTLGKRGGGAGQVTTGIVWWTTRNTVHWM